MGASGFLESKLKPLTDTYCSIVIEKPRNVYISPSMLERVGL